MVTVSYSAFLFALAAFVFPSSTPGTSRFLEEVRVVSVAPSRGTAEIASPDGDLRTLQKGDVLEEEGGAKLTEVSSSRLVFTRSVTGGDGEAGEARIVVRFDASGRTKVREYRTVGDVGQPRPR